MEKRLATARTTGDPVQIAAALDALGVVNIAIELSPAPEDEQINGRGLR